MHRFAVVALCLVGLFASAGRGQSSAIEPLRVAPGTILTFHIQTRLRPTGGDALDGFPRGTVLHVKMLDSVDSRVNPDGFEFRGSVVSSLSLGDEVVVHPDAEVHGLLVLLRSGSHPEGFRYELLITGITDHGKTLALTASLNPSFFEPAAQPAATPSKTATAPRENIPANTPSTPANSKLP